MLIKEDQVNAMMFLRHTTILVSKKKNEKIKFFISEYKDDYF